MLQVDALLCVNDVDAALDAGLMQCLPCPGCEPGAAARVIETQRRLAAAWAARDRYRARSERLARRAAERLARRDTASVQGSPGLPAAAAAALARAKAKAADRGRS
ncbi:MAG: hypothetical protein EOP92_42175 [Lysobacteraceae bacterium]|nr:MAG: hypothetical protein EOP92_42175 [Xanthomonadaceae bacterium]